MSEGYPITKATNILKRIGRGSNKVKSVLINSNIVAPKAAGRYSKNENLITSSFFKPSNKPELIVTPLLESPGRRARDWVNPTKKEFFRFRFLFSLLNLVDNRINPVKISDKATTNKLSNEERIKS